MWDVFEQYKFLKYLFDFNSDKVRNCGIGGIVSTLLIAAMGKLEYFALNILGVSLFFFVSLSLVMIVDCATGLAAAKRHGERRKSKKGLRWPVKYGSYLLFLTVMNSLILEFSKVGLDWVGIFCGITRMYFLLYIVYWEMYSIGENLSRLGYDARVFDLFQSLINVFKKTVKSKTDIDLKDDENKQ